MVRNKIKMFATKKGACATAPVHIASHLRVCEFRHVAVRRETSTDRSPVAPVTLLPGKHKIVILDEADSMTKGAQQVWRASCSSHYSNVGDVEHDVVVSAGIEL